MPPHSGPDAPTQANDACGEESPGSASSLAGRFGNRRFPRPAAQTPKINLRPRPRRAGKNLVCPAASQTANNPRAGHRRGHKLKASLPPPRQAAPHTAPAAANHDNRPPAPESPLSSCHEYSTPSLKRKAIQIRSKPASPQSEPLARTDCDRNPAPRCHRRNNSVDLSEDAFPPPRCHIII